MILPNENGKTYIQRLTKLYSFIYHKRFGEYPDVNYMLFGRFFKSAFEKHGEVKLASCIMMHFEQNGERIIAERFPIFWIPKNIDRYLNDLQNKHGVDIDSEEALYCGLKSRIKYLDIPFVL